MSGVFDDFAAIVGRIGTEVPAFALVASPSVVMSEDDVLRKLPGCYVMPGKSQPTENGNSVKLKGEDQDWIVLIAIGYPPGGAMPETELGEHVLGVITALNGWAPPGGAYKLSYVNRSAVDYEDGYASIRLRFTHRKVIAS
jgi:hypothetical protein